MEKFHVVSVPDWIKQGLTKAAGFIWEQHNEHRVPIPKLVLLGLYELTGGDFRCGMYFNVIMLGALGILMIRGAGRIRGRLSYADAFIPLLLLNWGHYEQILWSIE